MLSGRWVHAAVGQGGPVRHDELVFFNDSGFKVIYTTDGPFACAALFTVAELIAYAAEGGTLGANPTTLGLVLDFAIDAAYIGGNMLFVEAMKHKNVAQIRCAIAANRAAQESEIPNFKGSYLGRFPLVSADFWTSDHPSERSRSVDAFSRNARAR